MFALLMFGITLIGSTISVKLPDSITPCRINDSELASCILNETRKFAPTFVKGIPELGVASLDPLHVGNVNTSTAGLILINKNLIMKGISKMEIRKFSFDADKVIGHVEIFGNMTSLADYEIDGKILILPVQGKGKSIIKLTNALIKISLKFKLEKGENGKEYFKIIDINNKYTVERVRFHLDGLFGGDQVFTNTLNKLMNDNWRELMKELGGPTITAVVNTVINILNKFYSQISYQELFTL